MLLSIKKLNVSVNDKNILSSVDIDIEHGTITAIMGPNGSGKSTLASVIAGYSDYNVESGSILYKGKDLISLEPNERSLNGIFMSFQSPVEIPGVHNIEFLRIIYNTKQRFLKKKELGVIDFNKLLKEKTELLGLDYNMIDRSGVNFGLSGGEKKKSELLQMVLLEPELIILDEVDSGLDIDSLKSVSNSIGMYLKAKPNTSIIIVTHFPRILQYLKPSRVCVMFKGKLVKTGDINIAYDLELNGYDKVVGNV